MENFIIVVILLGIIAAITVYLIKAKKRGEKCIGCPYCKECNSKKRGNCNH